MSCNTLVTSGEHHHWFMDHDIRIWEKTRDVLKHLLRLLLRHGQVRGQLVPGLLQLADLRSELRTVGVPQVHQTSGFSAGRRPLSGHGLHLHGEILDQRQRGRERGWIRRHDGAVVTAADIFFNILTPVLPASWSDCRGHSLAPALTTTSDVRWHRAANYWVRKRPSGICGEDEKDRTIQRSRTRILLYSN